MDAASQGRQRRVGIVLAADLTQDECQLNVAASAQAVAAPVAKTVHEGPLARRPAQAGDQVGHLVDSGDQGAVRCADLGGRVLGREGDGQPLA